MHDILREQLGWQGIIISDDMHMGAIAQHYGLEIAIEKAINAGVDILMFSNNSRDSYDAEAASKAIATIKKLLNEGKITTAQIEKSYQKIIKLKAEM
jgi:beta-N-acetylhexosaminidase